MNGIINQRLLFCNQMIPGWEKISIFFLRKTDFFLEEKEKMKKNLVCQTFESLLEKMAFPVSLIMGQNPSMKDEHQISMNL